MSLFIVFPPSSTGGLVFYSDTEGAFTGSHACSRLTENPCGDGRRGGCVSASRCWGLLRPVASSPKQPLTLVSPSPFHRWGPEAQTAQARLRAGRRQRVAVGRNGSCAGAGGLGHAGRGGPSSRRCGRPAVSGPCAAEGTALTVTRTEAIVPNSPQRGLP